MKKQLLILMSAALLTACAEKEEYQQAVLADIQKERALQKEQNLKEYSAEPEELARCVVDTSANNMSGIFAYDPDRLMAYRNYTKMLTLAKSKDPKKTLEELRTDFGSPKALAEANSNYSESMMQCYSAIISRGEAELSDK